MIPAGQNLQRLPLARPPHAIDQSMLAGEPPRPPTGQVALQGLGSAGPAKRIAATLLDQTVEPFQQLCILALPGKMVAPGIGAKDDHGPMSS